MNHISIRAKDNCYAVLWSYGEICVHCECCSKDAKERRKARLLYWESQLDEAKAFDNWSEDERVRAVQEQNNKSNIRYASKRIKYYREAA